MGFVLVFHLVFPLTYINYNFHNHFLPQKSVESNLHRPSYYSICIACKKITSDKVFIIGSHPWCFLISANVALIRSLIATVVHFIATIIFETNQLKNSLLFQNFFRDIFQGQLLLFHMFSSYLTPKELRFQCILCICVIFWRFLNLNHP